MEKFLEVASISSLQCLRFAPQSEFLPEGAVLIDYLSVSQERMDNWRYPPREEITLHRRNRGLSKFMLEDVEVMELVTGVTKPEEIKTIVKWFWDQHGKD